MLKNEAIYSIYLTEDDQQWNDWWKI